MTVNAFTAHVLTTHDLKHMVTMLLSPTQYSLWEVGWKTLLNQLLTEYAGNNTRASLTMDHLDSERMQSQPNDQATNTPGQY